MSAEARHADAKAWDFAVAPPRSAPGVSAMVGYRALAVDEIVHRGMPSSRLTFILALDDGVEAAATEKGLGTARAEPVVIGGLHLTASHVRQRRGQAGVQLAIHPLAARAVFGVPAAELPVDDYDGVSVLGRWASELRERLTEEADWPSMFGIVSEHLARRHGRQAGRRAPGTRRELLHAWHLLERSGGRLPIADTAASVGLSPRHLGNLFAQELGRSPKQVAGLMRFENATAAIARQVERRGSADLAGIAAVAGYSDQAHLSREFARYAGLGPRAWIRTEFRNLQDGGHRAAEGWSHD